LLYIGIDVHKKSCNACIKDGNGSRLGELKFPNNISGLDKLLKAIDGRRAKAVLESTGNLWLRLYLGLEEAGVEVILSNPSKTKAIAEARLKNDKVDASTLADLLRAGLVSPCYVPPSEMRDARNIIRLRMNLVKDRTRVKNRMHSLLHKYELKGFGGSDQFGKTGMLWLKSLSLSRVDQLTLDTYIRQLGCLNQLTAEVEQNIAEDAVDSEEIRLLMTIPGIDFYTAMLFVSEIGDIARFRTSDRLVSWLGLAPRVSQSGEKCHHGKITKRGSPRVRWALVQAAHSAVRWDEHFQAKYERIGRRRGNAKAVVAVAREIAVASYHMLTRKETYRFKREESVRRKYKKLERMGRRHASPVTTGHARALCST